MKSGRRRLPATYPSTPRYPMKQSLISVIVLFIASMAFDFVIHGVILQPIYASQPAMMRSEADAKRHFPALVLAHVLIAVGVTAIYRRGREAGKPWLGQGIRFGIWIALTAPIANFLIYYAVQPIGLSTVTKQICLEGIAVVLLGIIAAALNKPATA